jgi:hypothetical protein
MWYRMMGWHTALHNHDAVVLCHSSMIQMLSSFNIAKYKFVLCVRFISNRFIKLVKQLHNDYKISYLMITYLNII